MAGPRTKIKVPSVPKGGFRPKSPEESAIEQLTLPFIDIDPALLPPDSPLLKAAAGAAPPVAPPTVSAGAGIPPKPEVFIKPGRKSIGAVGALTLAGLGGYGGYQLGKLAGPAAPPTAVEQAVEPVEPLPTQANPAGGYEGTSAAQERDPWVMERVQKMLEIASQMEQQQQAFALQQALANRSAFHAYKGQAR